MVNYNRSATSLLLVSTLVLEREDHKAAAAAIVAESESIAPGAWQSKSKEVGADVDIGVLQGAGGARATGAAVPGLRSRSIPRKLEGQCETTLRKDCIGEEGCVWQANVKECVVAPTAPVCGALDCSACSKTKTCEDAGCYWLKQGGASTCVDADDLCEAGDPLTLSAPVTLSAGYGTCAAPCPYADKYNCANAVCGYIDCGSCIGDNFAKICYRHQGNIGKESCLFGYQTCAYGVGNIGDGSCTGGEACYRAEVPIGNDACKGAFACCGATIESIRLKLGKDIIEDGDCNGERACCNLESDTNNVCAC